MARHGLAQKSFVTQQIDFPEVCQLRLVAKPGFA